LIASTCLTPDWIKPLTPKFACYASAQERIIISKDEDFFHLASQPRGQIRLLWVRLGNCRTKALLAAMERLWPKIEACLKAGDSIVELR
jgi:predicted nuclease of predicted toxin-antitoxin system